MFCPKCATQNVDGASFCRACGANISLVPQALAGQLPTSPETECEDFGFRRRRREPSLDLSVRSLMMGVAFAATAVLAGRFSPGGARWWFWLLVPAAIFFSRGFSSVLRMTLTKRQTQGFVAARTTALRPENVPSVKTGELMTPVPSVTEGTTRHLAQEAQTRHLDSHQAS